VKSAMKKSSVVLAVIFGALFMLACNESREDDLDVLPIYGPKEFIPGIDEDTVYHTIPFWNFTNQDGKTISKIDYQETVYVAYYFFTHCPTICPFMTKQAKRLQEETKELPIKFIAHTVDPQNDSSQRLKFYADEYQFDYSNFNFVTGDKKSLYTLGVEGYLIPSQEDALAPGGFLHSEMFVLIDKKSRIRGYYDGTEINQVDQLIKDIKLLINE
jgi:protein SCO1